MTKKQRIEKLEDLVYQHEKVLNAMKDHFGYKDESIENMFYFGYSPFRLKRWEALLEYLGIEWQGEEKQVKLKLGKFIKRKKKYERKN